jgi:hypothetical protein
VTFADKKDLVAQALSIVSENGIHGLEYNHVMDALDD